MTGWPWVSGTGRASGQHQQHRVFQRLLLAISLIGIVYTIVAMTLRPRLTGAAMSPDLWAALLAQPALAAAYWLNWRGHPRIARAMLVSILLALIVGLACHLHAHYALLASYALAVVGSAIYVGTGFALFLAIASAISHLLTHSSAALSACPSLLYPHSPITLDAALLGVGLMALVLLHWLCARQTMILLHRERNTVRQLRHMLKSKEGELADNQASLGEMGAACEMAEDTWRALFDHIPIGLYRTTPAGEILDANPALVEMLGYPGRDALVGVNVADLFASPEERDDQLEQLGELRLVADYEIRLRRLDGTIICAEDNARAVRDATGEVRYYEGSLRDATARKRTEEELRLSESRYRSIFNTAPNLIFVVDPEGTIVDCNQRAEEILGYSPQSLIGRPLAHVVHADSLPLVHDSLQQTFQKGQVRNCQYQMLRADGKRIEMNMHSSVLGNGVGQLTRAICMVDDITERVRLEEQLRQARQMEAIGRLAGGVAHDFNNLLTVINGYSHLMLTELQMGDPLREEIEEIHQAGQRAAELTRQLLAFGRRHPQEVQILDLNRLLERLTKLLSRLIGEDIRLVINPASNLGKIEADPAQIEQIIINLAANARDAMPAGGILTIRTANVELDTVYAETHPDISPGPYVMLSVSDNGTGMTPEVREHLFEPFFTTKEVGKGTGLGLATIYGIVKQNEGSIVVHSEPGRGSQFEIYLPWVGGAAPTLQQSDSQQSIPRGAETILVVEDNPAVRQLTERMLRRLGYVVLGTSSPAEAAELVREGRGCIDLVLTDVVMPGMNGPQLVAQLREEQPDLPALYISGYTETATPYRGLECQDFLVQKPLSMQQLAARVRQVLEEKGTKEGLQTAP